jgi:hypothetical protein
MYFCGKCYELGFQDALVILSDMAAVDLDVFFL